MSATDDFLKACGDGIGLLAKDCLKELEGQGKTAAMDFAKGSAEDLQRWCKLVAKGDLSKEEMADLLRMRSDRFAVEALKQKGLALVKIDEFKRKSIDLIVDSAFGLLKA